MAKQPGGAAGHGVDILKTVVGALIGAGIMWAVSWPSSANKELEKRVGAVEGQLANRIDKTDRIDKIETALAERGRATDQRLDRIERILDQATVIRKASFTGVTGKLLAVDQHKKTLTVEAGKERRTFKVLPHTECVLDGKEVELDAYEKAVGREVTVEYVPDHPDEATVIRVGPRPDEILPVPPEKK